MTHHELSLPSSGAQGDLTRGSVFFVGTADCDSALCGFHDSYRSEFSTRARSRSSRLFKSPLEDFRKAVEEAGLADRVTYLSHGETYNFEVNRFGSASM